MTVQSIPESNVRTIAGADCAFEPGGTHGHAGVVVYSYPDLEEIQRVGRRGKVTFPYIPGLLSFREAPLLLAAFEKLKKLPDVIMFDGQGLAHPRRFGIACHMGLLLDRPSIGCAKSRLTGEYKDPGSRPGQYAPLMSGDTQIGAVLRTRQRCKPLFVSVGHRMDLETSIRMVMRCVTRYRLPQPIREADAFVAKLKTHRRTSSQ